MFHLFFALLMAFAQPSHNPTTCNNTVATSDFTPAPHDGGTGGEGGHVHPDRP